MHILVTGAAGRSARRYSRQCRTMLPWWPAGSAAIRTSSRISWSYQRAANGNASVGQAEGLPRGGRGRGKVLEMQNCTIKGGSK